MQGRDSLPPPPREDTIPPHVLCVCRESCSSLRQWPVADSERLCDETLLRKEGQNQHHLWTLACRKSWTLRPQHIAFLMQLAGWGVSRRLARRTARHRCTLLRRMQCSLAAGSLSTPRCSHACVHSSHTEAAEHRTTGSWMLFVVVHEGYEVCHQYILAKSPCTYCRPPCEGARCHLLCSSGQRSGLPHCKEQVVQCGFSVDVGLTGATLGGCRAAHGAARILSGRRRASSPATTAASPACWAVSASCIGRLIRPPLVHRLAA